ncbi:MAG: hypothetical protein V3T63_01310 [Nitrosopumilaceae archaeon]|nr:MAG: hypothetical protein NPMRD1_150003 [Nitrosopumilales archaeon]
MIIHLVIIFIVVGAGVILMLPTDLNPLSDKTEISIPSKQNLIDVKDDTVETVQNAIDNAVNEVGTKIDDIFT